MYKLLPCALLLAGLLPAYAQQSLTTDESVTVWKIQKQYTLAVAQRMPAALYDYKPNPTEMTFGEQLVHIAAVNYGWLARITDTPSRFKKPEHADKASTIRILNESFDYVIDVVPKITPQQMDKIITNIGWPSRSECNGRQMLLNLLVHTAHHRAQCEVYMRTKNIAPPSYRF